jgi:hypothetical protein
VLPDPVLDKMRFIHNIIGKTTSKPAKLAEVSGEV